MLLTKETHEAFKKMRKDELKKRLFNKDGKPQCLKCGTPMINVIDSVTKKLSPYLWKHNCEHNKNLILSIG